ncbi:cupin domain-containing protein [Bacillus sp. DTU_2020_1000418_1_SI_GHA_SEK_038]|uniref:helix-turn-helix domain-containing protein n=1 Tax=Bacillus sp. DTU_2020_1000418_1_SI_GHA_SEK_038 TaxID=3077585 RepID=UPI0028E339DA|nr:cupin domain-containing protein [Bacillus sp. DTU_2020_1000418_1_SI_GHA_SEK_038]WNS75743.1 cupin domain-containing protein [Bacillus sp. DTU_2020_1000418_1_SI_GHA_SEK_038]
MDNKKLGNRVKSIRKNNKMTLKQVSEKTGLSISFLSQVERSKSSATLSSIRKISEALGVNLSDFFQTDCDPKSGIIKKEDHKEHRSDEVNFTFTNLSGITNPIFEPILATLYPGDKNISPYTHNGQEFIYILEGTLSVILDNKEYSLRPGDSIHIESTTPHIWYNDTEQIVKLLLITSPVI